MSDIQVGDWVVREWRRGKFGAVVQVTRVYRRLSDDLMWAWLSDGDARPVGQLHLISKDKEPIGGVL